MTGNVEADPEAMRRAAAKAQHVSDRINTTLTTLKSSTDAKGTPWGDDDYGEQFAHGTGGNGYEAARENLKKLTSELSGHSGAHGEGQQRSAAYHAETDTGSAHRFR